MLEFSHLQMTECDVKCHCFHPFTLLFSSSNCQLKQSFYENLVHYNIASLSGVLSVIHDNFKKYTFFPDSHLWNAIVALHVCGHFM